MQVIGFIHIEARIYKLSDLQTDLVYSKSQV